MCLSTVMLGQGSAKRDLEKWNPTHILSAPMIKISLPDLIKKQELSITGKFFSLNDSWVMWP